MGNAVTCCTSKSDEHQADRAAGPLPAPCEAKRLEPKAIAPPSVAVPPVPLVEVRAEHADQGEGTNSCRVRVECGPPARAERGGLGGSGRAKVPKIVSFASAMVPQAPIVEAPAESGGGGDSGHAQVFVPGSKRRSIKHWTVGRFDDPQKGIHFEVSLCQDKNPKMLCLRLSFATEKQAAGYVLFQVLEDGLALRGIEVATPMRGKGYSSAFLAIWLRLCFAVGRVPSTVKMDKPLISLLLLKFGFTPSSTNSGFEVCPSPCGGENIIGLWCENTTKLRSFFSNRTLKQQGMAVVTDRPIGGRPIFVNTCFAHSDLGALETQVAGLLQGRFEQCPDDEQILRRVEQHAAALSHGLKLSATAPSVDGK